MYPFLAHLRRDDHIHSKQSVSKTKSDWVAVRSDFYYAKKHATFQMHLQNKLGMWRSIQPSHTFCTSSRTGRLPPLCLWLFFCSRRECGESHHELNLTSVIQHFKLGMHRSDMLDQYPQKYWPYQVDQVSPMLSPIHNKYRPLTHLTLHKNYSNKFHTVIQTLNLGKVTTGVWELVSGEKKVGWVHPYFKHNTVDPTCCTVLTKKEQKKGEEWEKNKIKITFMTIHTETTNSKRDTANYSRL